MKQIILSSLVVGMGAAGIYVFATIGVRGSFYVIEPSMPVLLAETALFAGITAFGLWMFIAELRSR